MGARGWFLESGVTSVTGVTDKLIYMILKVFLVVTSLLLVFVGKCYKRCGCYMWFPRGVVAIDPKFVVGLRQQSSKSRPQARFWCSPIVNAHSMRLHI